MFYGFETDGFLKEENIRVANRKEIRLRLPDRHPVQGNFWSQSYEAPEGLEDIAIIDVVKMGEEQDVVPGSEIGGPLHRRVSKVSRFPVVQSLLEEQQLACRQP